ncbi:MAG TPA: SMI1/KNR4 family protein [Gemmataceae bacterium]|nr:SMI1/KNR4 family protein [Gemmataceae bacterium]
MPLDPELVPTLWKRIESALSEVLPDPSKIRLAAAATEDAIRNLETTIGIQLPEDLRASLRVHNGQTDCNAVSFCNDGRLLSVTGIADTWFLFRRIIEEQREQPADLNPSFALEEWWNTSWVPFAECDAENLCVNMDPTVRGTAKFGAVIRHLRSDTFESVAPSFGDWLDWVARRIERSAFTVDEDGFSWLDHEAFEPAE